MDETEVKKIVRQTIKELMKQELLKDAIGIAYKEISDRLQNFYAPFPTEDKELADAIDQLKGDKYRHILWMFYRDGYTVEEIAEKLNVDVRTVSRNKKRLCIDLYSKLMF